jgi:hypothetical protein
MTGILVSGENRGDICVEGRQCEHAQRKYHVKMESEIRGLDTSQGIPKVANGHRNPGRDKLRVPY